ncbi:hypothetical protein [Amycolatopsis azurea]|uniref:ESX-1 secretion-associated protein n=1 Tax=Amycolatopsis azurea DSM 43854 TaxID=1238180 RepID=M2Q9X8_9PSEU|nr:hypothetical protein [Amycolatopsis azurea]EMD23486.1 hypothetical protein C791_7136 [Amycolatopsis azurea DSM 43854]
MSTVAEGTGSAMDGPGFHVDVGKLEEAASGITKSVDDQSNFELRDLCGDSAQYGHNGIHDALMNFCVRWSDGLDTLTDDADSIGEVLTKAVAAYRAVDEAAAKTLTSDPAEHVVEDD